MADPYALLGLKKTASQAEIKSAFRKVAKRLHPDANPGDKNAERQFKEANAAYDLLSDPVKRRRFDAGEIDSEGKETFRASGFGRGGHPGGGGFSAGFGEQGARRFATDDLFSELFENFGGRRQKQSSRGGDIRVNLTVSFLDAAMGASKRVRLPTGRTVDVRVPPATESGQALRLSGLGQAGIDGNKAGDAIVEITVSPHKFFRREGWDIRIDLPITLKESVLGARVSTPTVDGPVMLTVPAGAQSGAVLRLKGKGLAKPGNLKERGDQLVYLSVRLPEKISDDLRQIVQSLADDGDELRRKVGLN
jgi:DnaJ-class molecular chaperone